LVFFCVFFFFFFFFFSMKVELLLFFVELVDEAVDSQPVLHIRDD
jgi:hypothetical protein